MRFSFTSHEIPMNSCSQGYGWLAAGLSTLHGWQPLRGIIGPIGPPKPAFGPLFSSECLGKS